MAAPSFRTLRIFEEPAAGSKRPALAPGRSSAGWRLRGARFELHGSAVALIEIPGGREGKAFGPEIGLEFARRQRPGIEEALRLLAALAPQELGLRGRLDAFCDHAEVEIMRHDDERPH